VNCCTAAGYESVFGPGQVERDVRRFRRKGLIATAAWLRDALARDGVDERSVLEIGGGIGAIQIELLEAGAARAENVEMVSSYESAAGELVAEHGLEGRVGRSLGDVVSDPSVATLADIVVMHRVICCYPDATGLIGAACDHARERIAITIPRESWWVRLGFGAMNTWLRVRRVAFRAYVHPVGPMLEAAGARGFHPADRTSGPLWQSVILRRTPMSQPRDPSPSAARAR
jgi:magnesium-protoporphyrin O-methyltransferase